MPGSNLKVFVPTIGNFTGIPYICSFNIKESFDTFFYGFMRGALVCIAIGLIFSGFTVANPFAPVDSFYWYSLEVFAL